MRGIRPSLFAWKRMSCSAGRRGATTSVSSAPLCEAGIPSGGDGDTGTPSAPLDPSVGPDESKERGSRARCKASCIASAASCHMKAHLHRRRQSAAATPSAVLPTRFFGLLLGNFEATQARAVSPRSRQRGLQRESYGGSKGTPKHTDSYPVCPVSSIICETQ